MRIQNLITGSSPVVIHRNGNPPEWAARWETMVADFLREPPKACSSSADLTILTWNSRPTKSVLERCLDHLGVPCLTLGRNVPVWRNDMKVYLTATALRSIGSTYVMGVDSDDVLVLACPDPIVTTFRSFGCDLLFGAEKTSTPEVPHLTEFEQSIAESVYSYLNSGGWIGTTDTCRRFFDALMQEERRDLVTVQPAARLFRADQGMTRKVFRRFHPAAQIDYHCRIFQNLWGVPPEGELLIDSTMRGAA